MSIKLSRTLIYTGILVAVFALLPAKANAAINSQISFQGKLTNTDSTNVADSTYSIRFRIYTDPTADAANTCSANSCKWEETQASVSVSSGLFNVNLGSSTALPGSVDFNNSGLYLGIKVGADAEMTPRIRFTAAPYAFNSELLDGLDSTQLVQLSPGAQQTGNINVSGTITSGSINGVTIGTIIQPTAAGALTVQSNGSNALTLSGSGVTINTPDATTATSAISIQTGNSSAGTAGSLSLDTGTTSTGTPTINIGVTNAKSVQIGNNASVINVMCGTGACGFGNNGVAHTTTIGSTTGAAITALQSGSGGITLVSGGNIVIGAADATGTLLVLDSKTGTDPTGTNGGMYYNSTNDKFRCYEASTWKNCAGAPSNASAADQAVGASTTAYLTGSMITIPTTGLKVGTTFTWRITMSKTAAGTVANTFDVRVGTNGTIADTARLTFTMGTQTAIADTAVVVITATVRSVSASSTLAGNYQMTHNLSTTGFDNTLSTKTTNVTSGTFDNTTAGLRIGLSTTTGASYSLTFQQVQATSSGL